MRQDIFLDWWRCHNLDLKYFMQIANNCIACLCFCDKIDGFCIQSIVCTLHILLTLQSLLSTQNIYFLIELQKQNKNLNNQCANWQFFCTQNCIAIIVISEIEIKIKHSCQGLKIQTGVDLYWQALKMTSSTTFLGFICHLN